MDRAFHPKEHPTKEDTSAKENARQAYRQRKGSPNTRMLRCGQEGHIGRGCKVALHDPNEATGNTYTSNWQENPTPQLHQQQQYYDGQLWNDDQIQVTALPRQQSALPPPSAQEQQVP